MLSPTEFVTMYQDLGRKKANSPCLRVFLLAIFAGFLIAMGGMAANVAAHAQTNMSAARVICGMLFPFALTIVILTGAELFTGNCLIAISVLERTTTLVAMLKNLVVVYTGNFIGSLLSGSMVVYSGQLSLSDHLLAAYTIKIAASKCSIPFGQAVILGILCNVLVCVAVMGGLSEKNAIGRFVGIIAPISFFVIGGFEHCVANMYYIVAGLFAVTIPQYAQAAAELGVDTSVLNWGNFFFMNLLPVTIGNVIGGCGLGCFLWLCHRQRSSELVTR